MVARGVGDTVDGGNCQGELLTQNACLTIECWPYCGTLALLLNVGLTMDFGLTIERWPYYGTLALQLNVGLTIECWIHY